MLKTELRQSRLAFQKSLSAVERNKKSEQIAKRFFENFDLSQIRFLHCFLPIEKFNEINTKLIFERIWSDFPQIDMLVPRVNFHNNEIENLIYKPEIRLEQNRWQIDEPIHNEKIEAEQIDLILVPLLAFDKKGFRAGYGKGFYDKLLARCHTNCSKIGLSYSAPVDEITDTENFDARLDFCITPEDIWKF